MAYEQGSAQEIVARRAILDWRDRHELAVLIALPRAWQDGRPLIEAKLDTIGWQELVTNPDAFITREIDPLVAQVIGSAVQRLLTDARAELDQVIEAQVELGHIPALADGRDASFDVLAGLGPLVAGIGVAAILPSAAVVSGAAVFGLIATSAVSAPILLGGLALAGVGVAAGVINTRDIWNKRVARMRERVEAHVNEAVLSLDHSGSLSALLITALRAAADRIADAG